MGINRNTPRGEWSVFLILFWKYLYWGFYPSDPHIIVFISDQLYDYSSILLQGRLTMMTTIHEHILSADKVITTLTNLVLSRSVLKMKPNFKSIVTIKALMILRNQLITSLSEVHNDEWGAHMDVVCKAVMMDIDTIITDIEWFNINTAEIIQDTIGITPMQLEW